MNKGNREMNELYDFNEQLINTNDKYIINATSRKSGSTTTLVEKIHHDLTKDKEKKELFLILVPKELQSTVEDGLMKKIDKHYVIQWESNHPYDNEDFLKNKKLRFIHEKQTEEKIERYVSKYNTHKRQYSIKLYGDVLENFKNIDIVYNYIKRNIEIFDSVYINMSEKTLEHVLYNASSGLKVNHLYFSLNDSQESFVPKLDYTDKGGILVQSSKPKSGIYKSILRSFDFIDWDRGLISPGNKKPLTDINESGSWEYFDNQTSSVEQYKHNRDKSDINVYHTRLLDVIAYLARNDREKYDELYYLMKKDIIHLSNNEDSYEEELINFQKKYGM